VYRRFFVLNGFFSFFPVRVAAITGTAVVPVTAYTLVIVVGLWIGVTAQTTERSVIPAGMAVNTLIPAHPCAFRRKSGSTCHRGQKVEGTQAVSL
jgi:hypothetical protein